MTNLAPQLYPQQSQALRRCEHISHSSHALEPALIIISHEHYIYYAYLDSAGNIRILEPDIDRLGNVSIRSIRGIFAVVRLYERILEYGMDEPGFEGQILGWVLEGLARRRIAE